MRSGPRLRQALQRHGEAMDRLAEAHELLDGPLDDPRALAGNLRDLRRINRVLGGGRLSLQALEEFAGVRTATWQAPERLAGAARVPLLVIDVGTGSADIPVSVRRGWPRSSPAPRFVAVDSRAEVIAAARLTTPDRGDDGIELVVADGRRLPWPDASFDVAHASLVLHHLDPDEAVAFLRELARVARLGVVVNDLERARIHLLGAWLIGHLLTRNPLTRNDAPLSVRRAYTRHEMAALLRGAGLRAVTARRAFLGHRYAISAVHDPPFAVRDAGGAGAGAGG